MKMEDDLNFIFFKRKLRLQNNGRRPQKNENGRQPQLVFLKLK